MLCIKDNIVGCVKGNWNKFLYIRWIRNKFVFLCLKNKEKLRDGIERKGKYLKKLNKYFFNYLNFVLYIEK